MGTQSSVPERPPVKAERTPSPDMSSFDPAPATLSSSKQEYDDDDGFDGLPRLAGPESSDEGPSQLPVFSSIPPFHYPDGLPRGELALPHIRRAASPETTSLSKAERKAHKRARRERKEAKRRQKKERSVDQSRGSLTPAIQNGVKEEENGALHAKLGRRENKRKRRESDSSAEAEPSAQNIPTPRLTAHGSSEQDSDDAREENGRRTPSRNAVPTSEPWRSEKQGTEHSHPQDRHHTVLRSPEGLPKKTRKRRRRDSASGDDVTHTASRLGIKAEDVVQDTQLSEGGQWDASPGSYEPNGVAGDAPDMQETPKRQVNGNHVEGMSSSTPSSSDWEPKFSTVFAQDHSPGLSKSRRSQSGIDDGNRDEYANGSASLGTFTQETRHSYTEQAAEDSTTEDDEVMSDVPVADNHANHGQATNTGGTPLYAIPQGIGAAHGDDDSDSSSDEDVQHEDLFEGLGDTGDFDTADFKDNAYHDDAEPADSTTTTTGTSSADVSSNSRRQLRSQPARQRSASQHSMEEGEPVPKNNAHATESVDSSDFEPDASHAEGSAIEESDNGTEYSDVLPHRDNRKSATQRRSNVFNESAGARRPSLSSVAQGFTRLAQETPPPERQARKIASAMAELPGEEAVASVTRPSMRLRRTETSDRPSSASTKAGSSTTRKQKISASMRGGSDEEDTEYDLTTRKRTPSRQGGQKGKKGALTKAETRLIAHAVEAFRDDYKLEQSAVNDYIQERDPRKADDITKEMWIRIQDAVPDRHKQSVIHACRRLYHNFVARGKWTQEQDEELREMVAKYGQKWSKIGQLINREQSDCRYRWRDYLRYGDKRKTASWTDKEETELLNHISEALQIIQAMRRAQKPKDAQVGARADDDLIDWNHVSSKMNHRRSAHQCREKYKRWRDAGMLTGEVKELLEPARASWRLDRAARVIRDFGTDDKVRLIRAVRGSGVGKDELVPWNRIANAEFEGRHQRLVLLLLWSRLRLVVPKQEMKTTRDCAQYLLDRWGEEYRRIEDLLEQEDGDEQEDLEEHEGGDEQEDVDDQVPVDRVTPSARKKAQKGKSNARAKQSATQTPITPFLVRKGQQSGSASVNKRRHIVEAISDSEPDMDTQPVSSRAATGSPSSSEDNEDDVGQKDKATMDDAHEEDDYGTTAGSERLGSVDLGMDRNEELPAPTPIKVRPVSSAGASSPQTKKTYGEASRIGAAADRAKARPSRPRSLSLSSIDVEAFKTRKKKKGKKQAKKATKPAKASAVVDSSDLDDDMEDIPAKLPIKE